MKGLGVAVRYNDIESAIKVFRNLTRKDGLLKALDMRNKYPNLTDRAKAKSRKAVARKRKRMARMERG